jgi:hypothetical protein
MVLRINVAACRDAEEANGIAGRRDAKDLQFFLTW